MGELSKQWHSARTNITPSTLQVQCKIDESAAHCCLIVITINLMSNLSITLYIIIHFCATVHLLKHTDTRDWDWSRYCASVTWVWITQPSTGYYCIPPLSTQTDRASTLLVDTCNPTAAENETVIKRQQFRIFRLSAFSFEDPKSFGVIKPNGDLLLLISGLQMFIKLLQFPDWQMNRLLVIITTSY